MSIYEKILAGEEPGFVIWENDDYAAILTNEPYAEGHTLVIPKKNAGDDLFELDDAVYAGLMAAAKEVGVLLKKALSPERLIVWVRGFQVPHVHVHLIPSHIEVDLVSSQAHLADEQELEKVYNMIKNGEVDSSGR